MKTKVGRTFLNTFLFGMFFVLSVFPTTFDNVKTTKADELSDLNNQINQLQGQLGETRKQKSTLENEVAIFDGQINVITLQLQATQASLAKTQSEIDYTLARIKAAEEELIKQKGILDENLRILYEEGQTSSIEVVAGSDNFSEFMNRTEYLKSIQDKVSETIDKIKALKEELDLKKKELETKKTEQLTIKNSQVLQRGALNQQKYAKDALLIETKGLESAYQEQLNNLASQRASIVKRNNEIIYKGSTSYPYGNPPPENQRCEYGNCVADAYGYYIGQCTSYAAWWRTAHGNPVPSNLGNANTWGSRAAGAGLQVDTIPASGDAFVMPYVGGYGHVGIVDSVNPDGTINISEYNWGVDSSYTTRTINQYNYAGMVFIH